MVELAFPFEIKRSAKRRSISIEVREAQVSVRAPMAASDVLLVGFLREKSAWVSAKIAQQQAQMAARPAPQTVEYATGVGLPFMGEQLRLVLADGSHNAVARQAGELHLLLSRRVRQPRQAHIRQLLTRWYEQQAQQLLAAKTQALCARMGLHCQQVKIRATRSKWGHCTSAGVIQYNWQILLAPEPVVDYLVAHEVCHLRYPNHSAQFWELVASVCPSYLALRRWLRQAGASLHL